MRFFILLLTIFLCVEAFSQEVTIEDRKVFEKTKKVDFTFVSFGLGIGLLDLYLTDRIEALTLEELMSLDKMQINRFDRSATSNWSPQASDISDVLEFSALGLPLPLFLSSATKGERRTVALMYGEVLLLNTVFTSLVKITAKRTRPFAYNEAVEISLKQRKNVRSSFFSGHTSLSAAMSFFTAKVFSSYYPNSKWKPVVWSAAAIYPGVMGYLRYKAGKHYPTDTIVGYAFGAAIGYMIPMLHKAKLPDGLSIQSKRNTIGLSFNF